MGKSSRMKFLVGHSGILVALFTCDDCIETFILMSWLILSFNTVLAAPIRTGYEGIRAGVSCYHFDARPLVACCAFYLDLLHQLFQGEVYLQLCGTPYGLFTKFTFKFTLGLLTGFLLQSTKKDYFTCRQVIYPSVIFNVSVSLWGYNGKSRL